jgi:hypothetical protein
MILSLSLSLSLSLTLITLTPNLLQQDYLAEEKRSSQTHTGCRQIITPTNPQNKRHPKCKLYKKTIPHTTTSPTS